MYMKNDVTFIIQYYVLYNLPLKGKIIIYIPNMKLDS